MTAWDIELEVTIPTTASETALGELRKLLVDTFITNAVSETENSTDGLEWNTGGRLRYVDFNGVLETIATAHRDFTFLMYYNSDDLLSTGHVLWAGGKVVFNEFRENLSYAEYRACGFDAESWLNLYADEPDEWDDIIDDLDSPAVLLADLYGFLMDWRGLDESDDEYLLAITKHPNYDENLVPLAP